MAKKKIVEVPQVNPPVNSTSGVDYKFVVGIEPLGASPDLGREDLNQAFKSLIDKINEIIKKG